MAQNRDEHGRFVGLSGVGNFDRQAREASRQVIAEATETIRAAALELYSELTTARRDAGGAFGSPVASGRYVASTRLGINQIDSSVEPRDPNYRYPPGRGPRALPPRTIRNRAISSVAARLRTFKLGDTIYVSNSLPYSRRIEIGGHSWQTPDGVFGPTVRNVQRKFANVRVRVDHV